MPHTIEHVETAEEARRRRITTQLSFLEEEAADKGLPSQPVTPTPSPTPVPPPVFDGFGSLPVDHPLVQTVRDRQRGDFSTPTAPLDAAPTPVPTATQPASVVVQRDQPDLVPDPSDGGSLLGSLGSAAGAFSGGLDNWRRAGRETEEAVGAIPFIGEELVAGGKATGEVGKKALHKLNQAIETVGAAVAIPLLDVLRVPSKAYNYITPDNPSSEFNRWRTLGGTDFTDHGAIVDATKDFIDGDASYDELIDRTQDAAHAPKGTFLTAEIVVSLLAPPFAAWGPLKGVEGAIVRGGQRIGVARRASEAGAAAQREAAMAGVPTGRVSATEQVVRRPGQRRTRAGGAPGVGTRTTTAPTPGVAAAPTKYPDTVYTPGGTDAGWTIESFLDDIAANPTKALTLQQLQFSANNGSRIGAEQQLRFRAGRGPTTQYRVKTAPGRVTGEALLPDLGTISGLEAEVARLRNQIRIARRTAKSAGPALQTMRRQAGGIGPDVSAESLGDELDDVLRLLDQARRAGAAGLVPSQLPSTPSRPRQVHRPIPTTEPRPVFPEGFISAPPRDIPWGSPQQVRPGGGPSEVPRAVTQAPVVPPSLPPGAGGLPRIGGVAAETQRTLDQAAVITRLDKAGAISKFFDSIPGFGAVRRLERPGLALPDNLITAHVGERSALADFSTEAFSSRRPLIAQINALFGKDVARGGVSSVPFKGTSIQARNPITHKFKDIVDNPELYDLTDEQRAFISAFEKRNDKLLQLANQGYGADIRRFPSKPGGAYLPNVDIGANAEAIREALGTSLTRVVSRGTRKQRVFQTARERMLADKTFQPETNIEVLLYGIDEAKGFASASQVFRTGIGGRTEGQLLSEFGTTKGWKLLGDGIDLYFPAAEATQIETLRRAASGGFFEFIENWRGTVLSSDSSPFTGVQAPMSFLFDPIGAARQWTGGLGRSIRQRDLFAAFREDALAADIAADLQGWRELAFILGRPLAGGRPEEFARSFLEMIPKVGPKLKAGNDAMFIGIIRRMKRMTDEVTADLVESGVAPFDAKVAAVDIVTKIIPVINPSRLGQSAYRAQLARVPFTSISFLRKPVELTLDASRAFAKMVLRKPLTIRERLATKFAIRFAASVQALSTGSAVIAAQMQGTSKEQAVKDTLPGGRYFMSVVFPDGSAIPIGGPYRSLINAILPREVKGAPFPVPFARIGQFIKGKITPALSTQIDVATNQDFFGNRITSPNASVAENLLRIIAYEAEGVLPLAPGEVAGGIRTGETPGRIGRNVVSQFLGSPFRQPSVFNQATQEIFPGRNFSDLDENYQRDIVTASDFLAPDIKRYRENTLRLRPQSIQGAFAQFDAIDEGVFAALSALADSRAKRIGGVWYTRRVVSDQYFAILAAARNEKNGVARALEFEYEPSDVNDPDPNRRALAQWFAAIDTPSVHLPGNVFDTGALTIIRKNLIAEWGEGSPTHEYVKRNTNRRRVPEKLLSLLPVATRTNILASRKARQAHMMLQH